MVSTILILSLKFFILKKQAFQCVDTQFFGPQTWSLVLSSLPQGPPDFQDLHSTGCDLFFYCSYPIICLFPNGRKEDLSQWKILHIQIKSFKSETQFKCLPPGDPQALVHHGKGNPSYCYHTNPLGESFCMCMNLHLYDVCVYTEIMFYSNGSTLYTLQHNSKEHKLWTLQLVFESWFCCMLAV